MENVSLKEWLDVNYGMTAAGRERAAMHFGTTTPTLYKWMASGKHYIQEFPNAAQIIEVKGVKRYEKF